MQEINFNLRRNFSSTETVMKDLDQIQKRRRHLPVKCYSAYLLGFMIQATWSKPRSHVSPVPLECLAKDRRHEEIRA